MASYENNCLFVFPSSVKGQLLHGSRSSDCVSSHFLNTGLNVIAVIRSGMKLKMQAPQFQEGKIYASLLSCTG